MRDYSRPSAARTQLALLQGLLLGLGFLLLMVACWALLGLFTPADNNMARLPGALRIGVYGGGILLAVRALIPSLREMNSYDTPAPKSSTPMTTKSIGLQCHPTPTGVF